MLVFRDDRQVFMVVPLALDKRIGLELYRSASKRVSKRAGAPFMKLNGKSRLYSLNIHCIKESREVKKWRLKFMEKS